MRVTSTGIKNGQWEKKYGKYGTDFVDNIPSLSIPFAIHNPPEGTKAYAVILRDNDAEAVVSKPWIHWLVANLGYENVAEGESRSENAFIQGRNSWGINYYGGMTPPNAPHKYDLHVYALNRELPLYPGFGVLELEETMQGHILESYVLSAVYAN